MAAKPKAAFLDFATLGPNVDTRALEALVDASYFAYSTPDEVGVRVTDCEIAILNKAKVSGEVIRRSPRLELITLSATGTDNVDTAAAKECGVAVANIRDYCSTALVQHVFALVLGLTQQIAGYAALVRAGAWQRSERLRCSTFRSASSRAASSASSVTGRSAKRSAGSANVSACACSCPRGPVRPLTRCRPTGILWNSCWSKRTC